MRKILSIMSLACIFLFTACSSDDDNNGVDNNNNSDYETITLNVGLPETRVEFHDNDLNKVIWKAADQISLEKYEKDGFSWYSKGIYMTVNIDKGGANICQPTFKDVLKINQYKVLHKGKNVTIIPDADKYESFVDYKFLEQVQNAAGDPSHINDHMLYRTDNRFDTQGLRANTMYLKPQACVIELNINKLPFYAQSVTDSYLVEFIKGKETIAKLRFMGEIDVNKDNKLYLAFGIQSVSQGDSIAFRISCGQKQCKAKHTMNAYVNYTPGNAYTASLNFGNNDGWEWSGDISSDSGSALPEGVLYERTLKLEEHYKEFTLVSIPTTGNYKVWVRDNAFKADGFNANIKQATDSYFISPKVTLGINNYVTFDSRFGYIGEDVAKSSKFCVREKGTAVWTECTATNPVTKNNETREYKIDKQFEGKEVEFAFLYHADKKNDANEWFVENLKVEARAVQ